MRNSMSRQYTQRWRPPHTNAFGYLPFRQRTRRGECMRAQYGGAAAGRLNRFAEPKDSRISATEVRTNHRAWRQYAGWRRRQGAGMLGRQNANHSSSATAGVQLPARQRRKRAVARRVKARTASACTQADSPEPDPRTHYNSVVAGVAPQQCEMARQGQVRIGGRRFVGNGTRGYSAARRNSDVEGNQRRQHVRCARHSNAYQ